MKQQLNEIKQLQKVAGLLKESLDIDDRIVVIFRNKFYGQEGTIKDIKGGFVIVSIDGVEGEYSMHASDVEKIEDEEDDEDDYGPVTDYGKRRQADDKAYYGTNDSVEEAESNLMIDDNPMDDIPSVNMEVDDDGNMTIQLSALFHSKDNGKIALLKNNPALQDVMLKAIQLQTQKAFRSAIHGVLGKPYGLK